MVYPGAYHTRFHHVIGSMHLANQALETLKSKGSIITEEESKERCRDILSKFSYS